MRTAGPKAGRYLPKKHRATALRHSRKNVSNELSTRIAFDGG